MRAQREKVKLMQEGEADDIVIEKCKYQAQLDEYREFSKTFNLKTQMERVYYDLKGRVAPSHKQYAKYKQDKEDNHSKWLHDIGAYGNTKLKTIAKYEEAKYNKNKEYTILRGYSRAVEKGDIHALTGFKVYRQIVADVESKLVGETTCDGVVIKSYATHFIDRIIGQTSTSHPGMRLGVPVIDAYNAIKNPIRISSDYTVSGGDVRRIYYGEKAVVTISLRDKRLIQTNPRGDKNENNRK